jgi:hypothetical protein
VRGLKTVELVQDRVEDALNILQDVNVPEAEHGVTRRFEYLGPRVVADDVGVESVLAAVELHDQMVFGAEEIRHETPDGGLALELQSVELTVPQP